VNDEGTKEQHVAGGLSAQSESITTQGGV